MVHIIYVLVCHENYVGDEMCRIVKKVETTGLTKRIIITEEKQNSSAGIPGGPIRPPLAAVSPLVS
jgi:hypothetical protein